MYRFSDNQLHFSDFGQPAGMKMSEENRWVKKAALIPWDEIEKRYACLFQSGTGNPAKPLRLALGALLIQNEYRYSDDETVLQIQEGPYLQYFCGLPEYQDEPPFDGSTMVWFRKRLTAEVLGEINELILQKFVADEQAKTEAESEKQASSDGEKPAETSSSEEKENDDNDKNPPPPAEPENKGTLIMDATCAPQNIRYPQDLSLLNECREKLEGLIDELCKQREEIEKPRTYRKNARRDYLHVARKRKKSAKELHRGIGKQLRYIRRDLGHIDTLLPLGCTLTPQQTELLQVLKMLFEQQLFMFENRCHTVENRIVSIAQPWLSPIVRGKTKAPTEFGAKLDISIADGFIRLEHQSFDAYNEAETLQEVVERYHERTGHYPERVLADKIYRNRNNLAFCREHHIRLSGPALGRPPKESSAVKKTGHQDECDRIEVERAFSHAKGKFGLGLIRTRLRGTTRSAIALSIVALNLARIWLAFFVWMLGLALLGENRRLFRNWAVIQ